ncbi:Uncharacterized protein HA466_0240370 [Hirschfeldia incana]|nr:Uncharacterized protein HA466_0240370 [Hirschfeldia incana]
MQDPRHQVPPSPTISSVSSSDLDTESTESFFHDRSITLGTLMGFSFTATMPMMPFRASSHHRHVSPAISISRTSRSNATRRNQRKRPPPNSAEQHRRRKWWRFCRDDDEGAGHGMHRGSGDCRRSSLGEYLEVERRSGDEAVYGSLEGAVVGGRALFADGRVLPPASAEVVSGEGTPAVTPLCRFPVSLTGICSGGGG